MLSEPAFQAASPGSVLQRLSRDTFIIGSGLIVGRLLGFVRELLLARAFGVSAPMDALVVALNIFDTMTGVLLGNAAAAVILPPLAQLRGEGKEQEFWWLSSNLSNIVGCILTGTSLLAVVSARVIAGALAPGLPHGTFELAVSLTRTACLSLLFAGMGLVLAAVLQARREYFVPAFTTTLHNTVLILFILFVVPGWGVRAVVWGVICSSALRLYALYGSAYRGGMRWRRSINWKHPQSLQILGRFLPAILGFSVFEVNLLIDRNFASRLHEGSIAALNYADKLVQMPLAVFAGALSIAVLPIFSIHAKNEDWSAMRRDVFAALGLMTVLMVPASLFLMVFRVPVINLVFRRGAFDNTAVAMTAPALFWYATGLPFSSANLVLVRIFHSRMDFKTPLLVGIPIVVFHIGLNWVCVQHWNHVGIAISSGVTALVYTLSLIVAIRSSTPLRFWRIPAPGT